MVKPRTMPGVLELMPAEQLAFQSMVDTIRRVYESFGFVPIETPAIELTDVLLTKTGGETERQIYFVQSTGAREQGADPGLALRFDLTVPLARYVAEHQNELAFPFRRYQIQRVYRGESPQRGRFREFLQCDIDVIGRERLGLRYDAEMPAVIHHVFTELGIGPFTIKLNSRRIMHELLSSFGVEAGLHDAVLREIDKLDKRGRDGTVAAIAGVLEASHEEANRLLNTVDRRSATHRDALELLDDVERMSPPAAAGVEEMRVVLETLAGFGIPESSYSLDLSIARGLDYYTGTVYETTLDDHPEVGSICSGGRYDDLAGQYTSNSLPGVGISIGLTRLFWQLRELGEIHANSSGVEVLVTLMDDEGRAAAQEIAGTLRAAGLRTQVMLDTSKLGKQLKYADRLGVPVALIFGDDERSRGVVTVRDMRTGSQTEVNRSALVDLVSSLTRNQPTHES